MTHATDANTKTDPDAGWRIVDDVTQLREWGTKERVYELPRTAFVDRVIGSSASCSIPLADVRVSRRHARLARDQALWWIHDLRSKNGTWIDGERRASATLAPGTEITLGPVTLIAESHDSIALRELICRWIGWSARRRPDVDCALRGVREAAMGRLALVLSGEGDLMPIATRLHREVLGPERPFVIHHDAAPLAASVEHARGGTLCFSGARVPTDIEAAIVAVRQPMSRIRVTVCSRSSSQAAAFALKLAPSIRIELTPLSERKHEMANIIEAYAQDAAAAWGQPIAALHKRDVPVLAAHAYNSHSDVEDSARRLVALRCFGVTDGAQRLGITHGALSTWAKRRGLRT